VHHIRFARIPQLTLMQAKSELEGLLYGGEIVFSAVFLDFGFEFAE